MNIPKSISPEPILESVAEFRFSTTLPPESIVGLLYKELKTEYKINKIEPAGLILELKDPAYVPKYLLNGEKYIFQVGMHTCTISKKMPYEGWEVYLGDILNLFNYLINLQIIEKLHQISLRYINCFAENIFDNINIEFKIKGEELKPNQTYFRSILTEGDYLTILQVGTGVTFQRGSEVFKQGSLLDIDTSTRIFKSDYVNEIKVYLENVHSKEKEMFFSILKKEYIKEKLNPKYE